MFEDGYKKYTTLMGDMWDLIAYKLYGDISAAVRLVELNPIYRHYAIFPAGIKLTVPKTFIQTSAADTNALPPWRKDQL